MRTPKPSFRTAPRPSLVLIAASAFLAACGKSDVPRGLVVSPPGHASGYVYYAPTGSVYLLDEGLSNYGDPADHPELLDISGGRQVPGDVAPKEIARFRDLGYVPEDSDHNPSSDLMHSNAIAYNAELDQIVLSGRFFSEIWIIDHGTTTEEARGHTGGRWGQGGDLLYRWGKPDVYGRGSEGDQTLFGQHDIRWVPEGMPGAGNLTVFNNDDVAPGGGTYSAVFEFAPPTDASGRYVLEDGEAFGPEDVVWSYTALDPPEFYGSFLHVRTQK